MVSSTAVCYREVFKPASKWQTDPLTWRDSIFFTPHFLLLGTLLIITMVEGLLDFKLPRDGCLEGPDLALGDDEYGFHKAADLVPLKGQQQRTSPYMLLF